MKEQPVEVSLYPLAPGHGGTDTSQQAAAEIESKADMLRKRCLAAVRRAPQHTPGVLQRGKAPVVKTTPATNEAGQPVGLTVREACELINEDNDNLNPRFSELRAAGLIRDSGVRRLNKHSGKKAVAWVPGDDPAKPQPLRDNSPPQKPAAREAYARGMAAAYHIAMSAEGPHHGAIVGSASEYIRRRLAEIEPGNPQWRPAGE
jgi:hypothetical protein